MKPRNKQIWVKKWCCIRSIRGGARERKQTCIVCKAGLIRKWARKHSRLETQSAHKDHRRSSQGCEKGNGTSNKEA